MTLQPEAPCRPRIWIGETYFNALNQKTPTKVKKRNGGGESYKKSYVLSEGE